MTNGGEHVGTRDRDQLGGRVDRTEDELSLLIAKCAVRKNDALDNGEIDEAEQLDALRARYVEQLGTVIRRRIRQIDDSEEMRRAIAQFSRINADIKKLNEEIESIGAFVEKATQVAQALDEAIDFVFDKIA